MQYLVSQGCDLKALSFRFIVNTYDALSLAIRPVLTTTFFEYSVPRYDKIPLIKYLIEKKGFKVKLSDGSGEIGNYETIRMPAKVLRYLIDHGLDPNYSIKAFGAVIDTLLVLAIREKDVKFVEHLLKKGADPNLNITGYAIGSAMHCVCCHDGYGTDSYAINMNILKLLLRYNGSLKNKISGFIARFGNNPYKERLNKTPLDFLYE